MGVVSPARYRILVVAVQEGRPRYLLGPQPIFVSTLCVFLPFYSGASLRLAYVHVHVVAK